MYTNPEFRILINGRKQPLRENKFSFKVMATENNNYIHSDSSQSKTFRIISDMPVKISWTENTAIIKAPYIELYPDFKTIVLHTIPPIGYDIRIKDKKIWNITDPDYYIEFRSGSTTFGAPIKCSYNLNDIEDVVNYTGSKIIRVFISPGYNFMSHTLIPVE